MCLSMNSLNLAIAKFYTGEVDLALVEMKALGKTAFINHYYLYHVAIGKMFVQSNDSDKAMTSFRKAIDLTNHQPEKRYINNLMEKISA